MLCSSNGEGNNLDPEMHKKVLILSLWFLPQVGGMEFSIYEIVNTIKDLGNEIVVVTADHEDADRFDSMQNFSITRVKNVFLKNLRKRKSRMVRMWYYLTYYLKIFIKVKQELVKFSPDEIIISDEQTRNWFGFFTQFIKINPIVIVSMPEKRNTLLKNSIVKRTLRKAKTVLCVSNSTKNEMINVFGKEFQSKMHTQYRSISDDFIETPINFEQVNWLKNKFALNEKFIILSICRLSEKKGIGNLIKAIYELGEKGKDVIILVVGEGPDESNLQSMVKSLGLVERVIFCGRILHDQIINYYDLCDIFVLPSIQESFGRVYVEAGARHKCSIACSVGGVTEVIENNTSGLLVPPNNISLLSKNIEKLMNDNNLRSNLSEQMYHSVVERFTNKAMGKNWERIIG